MESKKMEGLSNPEGVAMLKTLAENGDFESQVMLAHMYHSGEGVAMDLDESLYWCGECLKHSDCGDEKYLNITYCAANNHYCKKEYKQALQLYESIYEKIPDIRFKDKVYMQIARTHWELEDDQDLPIYEYFIGKTDIINTEDKNIKDEYASYIGLSNYRLGMHCLSQKEYLRSIDYLLQTIIINPVFKKNNNLGTDDCEFVANVYNNVGYACEMLGKYKLAVMYYSQSSKKGCKFADLNLWHVYGSGIVGIRDEAKAATHYELGKDSLEEWLEARSK